MNNFLSSRLSFLSVDPGKMDYWYQNVGLYGGPVQIGGGIHFSASKLRRVGEFKCNFFDR